MWKATGEIMTTDTEVKNAILKIAPAQLLENPRLTAGAREIISAYAAGIVAEVRNATANADVQLEVLTTQASVRKVLYEPKPILNK